MTEKSEITDQELLERLAGWIVERRMTAPAIIFLESHRPMSFVGSQFMSQMQAIAIHFHGDDPGAGPAADENGSKPDGAEAKHRHGVGAVHRQPLNRSIGCAKSITHQCSQVEGNIVGEGEKTLFWDGDILGVIAIVALNVATHDGSPGEAFRAMAAKDRGIGNDLLPNSDSSWRAGFYNFAAGLVTPVQAGAVPVTLSFTPADGGSPDPNENVPILQGRLWSLDNLDIPFAEHAYTFHEFSPKRASRVWRPPMTATKQSRRTIPGL